ncbi:MAG: hypothetical protein ACLU4J_14885 [Butyricimonas paravirosa]
MAWMRKATNAGVTVKVGRSEYWYGNKCKRLVCDYFTHDERSFEFCRLQKIVESTEHRILRVIMKEDMADLDEVASGLWISEQERDIFISSVKAEEMKELPSASRIWQAGPG